jgi:hypothetical protein
MTTTGFTFPLLNVANSWSLTGLYGCTSVIVMSRKRMYMTHIWEHPTMALPGNMQAQALGPLRNGDNGTPGLQQFVGPGGDFENTPENKVRIYIITPLPIFNEPNQPRDVSLFPDQVGQIEALLTQILGRDDTVTLRYVKTGPDPDFKRASGRVFIQYDPVDQWMMNELCYLQTASIELWFEDTPRYRYKDSWIASANQLVVPESLKARSVFRPFGACKRPSQKPSASSVTSTSASPTTLQTSVVSSSSAPTPTPPLALSKALSVILVYFDDENESFHRNYWGLFETTYKSEVDSCHTDRVWSPDASSSWTDSKALDSPPWPHTSHSTTLYGEESCQYFNDGTGAGSFTCPSLNGRVVDCREHPERTQKSATHRCNDFSYHRAVYCEW